MAGIDREHQTVEEAPPLRRRAGEQPSAPSTSAEIAQDPSPSLKASSLVSARRRPRPGESSDIASRRFVLPAPFGPTSTTTSPPTAIFAAW
jgi:hypothetical protein